MVPVEGRDFFPQQQNAMGSLHNIDFGVFWASWGGSRGRFLGQFLGFRRLRARSFEGCGG